MIKTKEDSRKIEVDKLLEKIEDKEAEEHAKYS